MLVPMGVVLFKYPELVLKSTKRNRVFRGKNVYVIPKTNMAPEKSGKSETTFFLGPAYFQVLCYVRFFFGSVYREHKTCVTTHLTLLMMITLN